MDFEHIGICDQLKKRQRHSSPYPNDFTTLLNNNRRDSIDASSCFDEYDHAMKSVQLKADLQDCYYGLYNLQQQQQEQQRNKDTTILLIEEDCQEQQHEYSQHTKSQLEQIENNYYFPGYYDKEGGVRAAVPTEEQQDDRKSTSSMEYYNNHALLYLILDVQSYISEMSNTGIMNERDSPLLELQYKMYIYMKHRASEAGFRY